MYVLNSWFINNYELLSIRLYGLRILKTAQIECFALHCNATTSSNIMRPNYLSWPKDLALLSQ